MRTYTMSSCLLNLRLGTAFSPASSYYVLVNSLSWKLSGGLGLKYHMKDWRAWEPVIPGLQDSHANNCTTSALSFCNELLH